MGKSRQEIAEEWLYYSVLNWQNRLSKLKALDSRKLFNSFQADVVEMAGGDQLKLEIAYRWYGQMIDMGVGSGTKAGDVREQATERRLLGGNGKMKSREKKSWYRTKGRDGIAYQMLKLSQLLGDKMYATASEKIDINSETTIEI